MTDLDIARAHLDGHSICLCKGGEILTDDGRGISPMMRLLAERRDLRGFSVADLIVGKAAAMLFVKAGIACAYGEIMSEAGREYLIAHDIPCTFGTLTQRIINRRGDDICPMERTVQNIDDCEAGYLALRQRLEELRSSHKAKPNP